jgi:hypothetical protein
MDIVRGRQQRRSVRARKGSTHGILQTASGCIAHATIGSSTRDGVRIITQIMSRRATKARTHGAAAAAACCCCCCLTTSTTIRTRNTQPTVAAASGHILIGTSRNGTRDGVCIGIFRIAAGACQFRTHRLERSLPKVAFHPTCLPNTVSTSG